jgi:hypothetical protein
VEWVVQCAIGYNELDFFKAIKNPDPVMGETLKSKTFTKYVFGFFEPLFAPLA